MPDGQDPNNNAPAAPAADALDAKLLELCLKTNRPVYRQVEDLLPEYLRWGHGEYQRLHRLTFSGMDSPKTLTELVLLRTVRYIRRMARTQGHEAVVMAMQNRSYQPFQVAFMNVVRDERSGVGTAEDSGSEDEYEEGMWRIRGSMIGRGMGGGFGGGMGGYW